MWSWMCDADADAPRYFFSIRRCWRLWLVTLQWEEKEQETPNHYSFLAFFLRYRHSHPLSCRPSPFLFSFTRICYSRREHTVCVRVSREIIYLPKKENISKSVTTMLHYLETGAVELNWRKRWAQKDRDKKWKKGILFLKSKGRLYLYIMQYNFNQLAYIHTAKPIQTGDDDKPVFYLVSGAVLLYRVWG